MNDKAPWWVGVLGWGTAFVIFLPILIIAVTAFKTEQDAYSLSLLFKPTLQSFNEVFERSHYLALSATRSMSRSARPSCPWRWRCPRRIRWRSSRASGRKKILLWMLSTKMMPAVGVLIPIYLLAKTTLLLDSITADHHLHADQSADCGVDGIHLLQ